MLTKDSVFKTLQANSKVFENDGVLIVGLFGSFSRDNATKDSDVDILIETKPVFHKKYKGLRAIVKLSQIKEFFENEFQREIDLVDRSVLSQNSKEHILKKALYV